MDKVTIYIIHKDLIKDNIEFVSSFVSKKQKEKATKYVYEKDKLLSYGASFLLKKYLPSEDIKENKNGKPYLDDGPYFNISHSGSYAVLAIHPTRDIGVDIEKINPERVDAVKYVLDDIEKKETDSNKLFMMWSNKESVVKCISSGLNHIKTVPGLPLEGVRTILNEDYFTKSLVYDAYSLSVTLKGNQPFEYEINRINKIN